MLQFIFSIYCGILWMWRGYSHPRFIRGYLRAFITSFLIIGLYCLWFSNQSVFEANTFLAVIVLALLESAFGYGTTCEKIDNITNYMTYDNNIYKIWNIPSSIKEEYSYLGLVGMCYYLFPYMCLHLNTNPMWFIIIAVLGYRIFPLAKYAQLASYNSLAVKYKLDPWKMVEASIGMAFTLLCIGG